MKPEDANVFTEKCFNGEPAPCTYACPFRLDVRSFIDKAEKGKWQQAYKTLSAAVVFPVIVSALCPAPCAGSCQRTRMGGEAIAMRDLEETCVRLARNHKPVNYAIPPKTERIAVIGAGSAGLSCALNLARKKFTVTVFEKNGGWGGKLRLNPRFEEFSDDIALQFSALDAEFRFETEIKSLDELSDFGAAYVATGAGGDDFGLLSDWDAKLLTTAEPKVFMGGSLAGADTVTGIAQGISVSKLIEVFLQTGRTSDAYVGKDTGGCARNMGYTSADNAPRVTASSPKEGYTERPHSSLPNDMSPLEFYETQKRKVSV